MRIQEVPKVPEVPEVSAISPLDEGSDGEIAEEVLFDPEIEQLIFDLKQAIYGDVPADKETYIKAIDFLDENITDLLGTHTNIYRVTNPVQQIITVGDTHGTKDLLTLMSNHLKPSEQSHVIFMGDYVDRGQFSLENLLLILFLKLRYPDWVHVLRGNHEDEYICSSYRQVGFRYECERKLPRARSTFVAYWKKLMTFFAYMPLACIANGNFYVHGGIPIGSSGQIMGFDETNEIDRFKFTTLPQPTNDENQCLVQMLWGDPRASFGTSDRGEDTFVFGSEETIKFFRAYSEFGLKCVVRAHEVQKDGYIINHLDDTGNPICITVFSASRYCGGKNKGAVASMDPHGYIGVFKYENDSVLLCGDIDEEEMDEITPRTRQ